MLREHLEAHRPIPTNTQAEEVVRVMATFILELDEKLQKRIKKDPWTVSGSHGAIRLHKRRVKLGEMIGKCAQFLGVTNPIDQLPQGWEYTNLFSP